MPRFVDLHRLTVAAPRDRVWRALHHNVNTSLLKKRDNLLVRLLETEPRSGFAVCQEVPATRIELTGRHRFSRYLPVFALADADAGKTPRSRPAPSPAFGLHGRAHRMLVIGSRGHVIVVRAMLRSIRRASLRTAGTPD